MTDYVQHGGIRIAKPLYDLVRRRVRGVPGEQVDRAFQLTLSRNPTPKEREQSLAFLRTGENALTDFSQVMLNLNEFVYIP